uniref:hypothetical protein n=1 Tax=Bacillus cytotoxicus TaxID=580165 RepID=UPI0020426B58
MRCSNKERKKLAGYFLLGMAATCVLESQGIHKCVSGYKKGGACYEVRNGYIRNRYHFMYRLVC